MFKKSITIQQRIFSLAVCGVLVTTGFGAFSLWQMDSLKQFTDRLYHHPYAVGHAIRDFESNILIIESNLEKVCNPSYAQRQNRYETIKTAHQANLAAVALIEERFLGSLERVAAVKNAYKMWFDGVDTTANHALNQPEEISPQKIQKLRDELSQTTTYLKDFASMKGKEFFRNAQSNAQFILLTTAAFLLLSFVGLCLYTYLISRALTTQLTAVAHQLKENTTTVEKEASDISSSSSGLSGTVSEQASALHETASSVEELSAMVKNNVRQAEQSKNLSEKMSDTSEEISQEIGQLTQSMKEIVEGNEKIEELVMVIEKIGDKTRIIDEIAFQTKILSLNASVEAEKAGEHGRGFSVVAQEVSSLAQMSGQASNEISEIVKNSVRVAKEVATKNERRVRHGEELVEKNARSITTITNGLKDVHQSAEQILSASQDQADGISQVNQAMGELNSMTQQNSVLADQSAAVAEKLETQVADLRVATQLVTSLVGIQDSFTTNTPNLHSGKVVSLAEKRKENEIKELGTEKQNSEDGWKAI